MTGFQTNLLLECLPREESNFRFKVYERPFEYITKDTQRISVPVGFKTDFATVPWFFRRIIPATGRHNEAAVIHDYLCYLSNKDLFDRRRADRIFYEAMLELEVNRVKGVAMHMGVRSYTEALLLKNKVFSF